MNRLRLSQDEYNTVWGRFEFRFNFRPDYYETTKPAILETPGSVVYSIAEPFEDNLIDPLSQTFIDAYAQIIPKGHWLYWLDWQHDCYKLDLHNPDNTSPHLDIFPDGDYFITLNETMSLGTFGHPWQESICVFGAELVKRIDADPPKCFSHVIRRNP